MYIKRDMEKKILEASQEFASITIYGSRQVGKSTLIKELFPLIKAITLDDLEIRGFAINDPAGFLKYYGYPLIIDEIQKAPLLLDYIKITIDDKKQEWLMNNQKPKLLYIISGSNQFELQQAVAESLAGRTCVFHLSSFSYNEIKQRSQHGSFNPDISLLKEKSSFLPSTCRSRKEIFASIFDGGMPEYIISRPNRDMFFHSYISTYIEKDVKRIIAVDKETVFMNFMKYVALRTGCQIDYTDLSRNVGIDVRTVKNWLSILETSGIICLLHPYLSNYSQRIIKTSKLYFMDTGLCCYLSGISSADILEKSAFSGAFYETYVVSEIIKSDLNSYQNTSALYYYRDRDQFEVDLIIDAFESIYPIEIKKGINPVSYTKSFSFLKKYHKPVNIGLIIDSFDKVFPINQEVYYCPIDIIGL